MRRGGGTNDSLLKETVTCFASFRDILFSMHAGRSTKTGINKIAALNEVEWIENLEKI
jgi:hypothetical protein